MFTKPDVDKERTLAKIDKFEKTDDGDLEQSPDDKVPEFIKESKKTDKKKD